LHFLIFNLTMTLQLSDLINQVFTSYLFLMQLLLNKNPFAVNALKKNELMRYCIQS